MGFWYSEYATFTAHAKDWAEAINILNKVSQVSLGDDEYAEDGIKLEVEYNCYYNKAIIRFNLHDEGAGCDSLKDWFNRVCKIPEILNGLYRYRDGYDYEEVEYGKKERRFK